MNKSIAQIKLELLKADGGQVPSGPSPEMLARLMQLKEQLKPGNDEFNRRQQGIINNEKMNGPLRLPTDQKAKGGVAHMDKGGRPPQQTNLDMAREAAERIGQHHDPITRSLQQGYEHDWYHGGTGDIKAFDPNTRGESTGAASAKKGYFFARDPSTPPPEMLEHDPESLAMLQKIGATIPPKPIMAGHGAHTASSYAGAGGSRQYKEAMRMAKAAEKAKDWDAYEKYMQMAEDAEINNMRYRQDLVAKHGDARDVMYEHIKNAWYGAHNAEMFKGMSQPDYEAHDKRYKDLMPYGWHIDYEKPHYEALKAELQKFGNNKQVKSALDAINHYQSVHNERRAADVESGANVMPVALRYKNPMYHDFKGSSYRDQTYSDLMDEALRKGHDALILKNTFDPGGIGKAKMVDVGVMFHPSQVRSKFAAFDPTRIGESDLLAKRGGRVTHAHLAIGGQGPKNWIKGGVEDVVNPMLEKEIVGNKHYPHGPELDEATRQRIAELQQAASKPGYVGGAPKVIEHLQEKLKAPDVHKAAMNQWVQRNLTNYIKKQMATHDDPIRKLAEQGIVHMPPEQMGYGSTQAEGVRKVHGAPRLGVSPEAQAWEDAADVSMHPMPIKELHRDYREPWMVDADPQTKIFTNTDNMHAHYLGFDHLVDVLKQDLAEGRIRPDQLHKVSIEHAVRRAHEYDQERKKAMAETALKATEGMPVHKEYPKGYKWIELALNPELPEGYKKTPAGTYVDPEGNESIHHPNYAKLDDALKYEGDTMGHCVGGYTPDVVAGKSRIFSLRDAKNEPHVTVEVNPPSDYSRAIQATKLRAQGLSPEESERAVKDIGPEIKQIKGKGNAKPKKDYIPYVQDFVKSGKWSDVGDIKNADMIKHQGQYMTHAEHDDWLVNQLKPDAKARGGIIHKAEGGSMDTPDLAQSRLNINQRANPALMDNIGINEALDMSPKTFINPDPKMGNQMPVGGVEKVGGLPIGGVDQSAAPGVQLAPQAPQQPQQDAGAPQGGLPQMGQPPSAGPSAPPHPSNILSLTPQGRALGAMAPQGMARGGSAKQRAQDRFAMEKQMAHLADGGQPPKRRTFAIQPANQAPKTETQFTPYDPEKISIKNLARAFDEAISHHLSLSHEDRIANSAKAAKVVGGYIGLNHEGKTKDLLGKNAKLLKTEEGKGEEPIQLPDGRGVETTGLALAPAYEEAGFNTCPNSASCKKECLGKTSGNYFKLGGGSDLDEFEGPRLNSLLKTQAFLHDPHAFAVRLHDEIQAAKDMAGANGNHLGVRLNVLSDINPRVHKAIIHAHPDVTFYDYTKNNTDPIAPNHHYTYSSTGASQDGVENENTNWKQMRKRLLGGDNVAMAFTHKKHLPEHVHDEETGQRFKVIDGDSHDFRPMDMQPEGSRGVIVGLKNKKATGEMNKAHIDSHGFFLHFDPQEKMTTNARGKPVYEREPSYGFTPSGKPRTTTIATNKEVRIKPQNRDLAIETNDGAKNEKA